MNYASSYSLRTFEGTILDQGQIGSCVENALVTDIDLIMRQAGHEIAPLSRMQSYADTRTADNYFDYDIGSIPTTTLNQAMTKGLAFESSWSYDPALLYQHPTTAVYTEASQNKVTAWHALNINQSYGFIMQDIKTELSEGHPVLLAFRVDNYFYYKTGPLSTQINYGDDGATAGPGHMVTIVGMDDNLNGGSLIVKNSWGTGWGDNGYGTISYQQFNETGHGLTDASGNYIWPSLTGLFVVDGFKGMDFTWSAERLEVAREYATILQRAPDTAGMDYWASGIKAGLTTEVALANMLITSTEGASIFGAANNASFLSTVYHETLGRDIDVGGLSYWSGVLNAGYSRGDVFISIEHAPEAAQFIANKTNVAAYVAIALQNAGGHDAATHTALESVTTDVNQVEVIKVGLGHVFTGLV